MSDGAPDIFLSYNREDAAVAQTYRDAFEREGFDVWWDATLRSGEAYDEVTEAALRGAKAVVVLWSPRSVASRWVRAEATIAARNKTLMPVTIEPCERPVMFELTQTAELSHWQGAANDKAWLAFLDDVRRMVGQGAPKPAKAVPEPVPTAAVSGEGDVPLVAMLPLTHRAGDEEMEVLAEDLTEDITRGLARCHYFKVIAAGDMATWRGRPVDHHAVGQQLKARYLIEGKVQRIGEDVHLSVRLIDIDTAGTVWSERSTGRSADPAASPEGLAVLVSSQLREKIIQAESNRAMTKQGHLSAWDHVLRAEVYMARTNTEDQSRDIVELRSAVEAAPDFGLAHALLADRIVSQARVGGTPVDEAALREVQSHLRRAIELDGNNPDVLGRLSAAHMHLGDAEAGLRLARRAAQLDPYSAHAQFRLALAHFSLGRLSDTVDVVIRLDGIMAVDSTSYGSGMLSLLGICLFMEGRDEDAEAAIDRSLAFAPNYFVSLRWKAIMAAARGREQAARVAVMQLRRAEPGKTIDQYLRSPMQLPFEHPRKDEAVAILRRLLEETEGDA